MTSRGAEMTEQLNTTEKRAVILLSGGLDFVVIPQTIDPDSRMWGGKTPLDLRVELVDAKNHWYTIHKAV